MLNRPKHLHPFVAVIGGIALMGAATLTTYAEVAPPPPPPPPPLQIPPPLPDPKDCQTVGGFQLQENGSPIPFLKIECPSSDDDDG